VVSTSVLVDNTKADTMRLPAAHDNTAPRTRSRRMYLAIAVGLLAATTAPLDADARIGTQHPANASSGGGNYVTTTTPSARSIDVSGFRPVCIGDAPFISYAIVPVGFTPVDQSATLVIRAADGTEVGTETVDGLSGQIIWPGASVDAAGNATDWPGWRRAADGVSWEPDPTDAIVRDGLTIEVTVDGVPPATATVDYPPDDSDCANPPITTTTTTTPATTTPCVPDEDDDCDLSTTGGEPGNLVLIGAASLLAGLAAIAATRRRRSNPVLGSG
jgi:hypothetical protein